MRVLSWTLSDDGAVTMTRFIAKSVRMLCWTLLTTSSENQTRVTRTHLKRHALANFCLRDWPHLSEEARSAPTVATQAHAGSRLLETSRTGTLVNRYSLIQVSIVEDAGRDLTLKYGRLRLNAQ